MYICDDTTVKVLASVPGGYGKNEETLLGPYFLLEHPVVDTQNCSVITFHCCYLSVRLVHLACISVIAKTFLLIVSAK